MSYKITTFKSGSDCRKKKIDSDSAIGFMFLKVQIG